MWRCLSITIATLLVSRSAFALLKDPDTKEVCPEVCEPEKCPNVGPIGLSQCPAEQYIVTYRCGCCKKCDLRPVTTTISPTKRDEVCKEVTCSKKKVCVLNIQGLPVCKCPTEELCRKFLNRGVGKKLKVCGTDGVTYASRCHIKVASCESDGKIRVSKKGECDTPEPSSTMSTQPVTSQSTENSGSTRRGRKHSQTKANSHSPAQTRANKHNNHNKRVNRRGERKQQKRQNRKKEKTYQRAL